jgi:hypothetical protein
VTELAQASGNRCINARAIQRSYLKIEQVQALLQGVKLGLPDESPADAQKLIIRTGRATKQRIKTNETQAV